MKATTKIFRITRVGLEAGQRSYIVTVGRKGHRDGDLAYFPTGRTKAEGDDAYRRAAACVESVKRGRWVGSRDGWSFRVEGAQLTATRTA